MWSRRRNRTVPGTCSTLSSPKSAAGSNPAIAWCKQESHRWQVSTFQAQSRHDIGDRAPRSHHVSDVSTILWRTSHDHAWKQTISGTDSKWLHRDSRIRSRDIALTGVHRAVEGFRSLTKVYKTETAGNWRSQTSAGHSRGREYFESKWRLWKLWWIWTNYKNWKINSICTSW